MPTQTPSRTSTALALTLLLLNGSGLWVGCSLFRSSKTESNQKLENADGLPGVYYEVKPGDTLWALSKHYDVPVDELKEVNGLTQAQGLAAGQLLFIPTPMGEVPQGPKRARFEPPKQPSPRSTNVDKPLRQVDGQRMGWPLANGDGVLYRTFRAKREAPYEGISLGAPEGTHVLAVLDGEVKYVGEEPNAFGKLLLIKHAENHITVYAHLESTRVVAGSSVKKGTLIGTVGQSGRTESPQLFFQVREDRKAKNPLDYLSLAGD